MPIFESRIFLAVMALVAALLLLMPVAGIMLGTWQLLPMPLALWQLTDSIIFPFLCLVYFGRAFRRFHKRRDIDTW